MFLIQTNDSTAIAMIPIEALEKAIVIDNCSIVDENKDVIIRVINGKLYNNIIKNMEEISYDNALIRLINRLDYLRWKI